MRIGWERDFLKESTSRFFYTEVVKPRRVHVIDQQMELLRPLGIEPDWDRLAAIEAPPAARDAVEVRLGGARDFILINPGGSWATKRWAPERFGEVARMLMNDGHEVVVTWGPGEEADARAIRQVAGPGLRMVESTLTELVALCERARLFVGVDTGPMHFAAAVGTPVVAVFGPTSSDRNGPFRREDAVVELRMMCRPCYARERCPLDHLDCMQKITADQVYDACVKRLAIRTPASAHH
jgi:ADP-heptose:LPS heptosyltransferase